MKKFIAIIAAVVVALGGAYYAYFYAGFYIDFHPNKLVEAKFTCDGERFFVEENGLKKPLQVKGIVLESAMPGHYFSDYKINQETYAKYLEQIGSMGANTVRIKTIMNPAFYEALLEYNASHEKTLYLLQGIGIEDYDQNNDGSYYDYQFTENLIRQCKKAVDVVHGRAAIGENRINGSGTFRSDVSNYCLGYIVGDYWIDSTIAYTNNSKSQVTSYIGDFFSTGPDATDFECIMAQVMDQLTLYETNKYKTQRLVSFINGPSTDPFDYLYNTRIQVDKVVQVDYENIIPQPALQSGYFAAYNMYSYISSFADCLEDTAKEKLSDFINSDEFDPNSIYNGYIQVLNYYHSMPVLIASYGYSSARGGERSRQANSYGVNLTEAQQGELLVSTYQEMVDTGCTGAVISSFQDNWSIVTWNTQYAVDENYENQWCDVQMPDNCYGLLAFDPGEKRSVCYVDGEASEWDESHLIGENGSLKLYFQYDSSYLYFYVKGAETGSSSPYYIPIDITPNSGSHYDNASQIKFNRNADFLIKLNGPDDSGIYVQEYYNGTYMEYGEQINLINRFYNRPAKNSPVFEPISFILKKDFDPDADVSKMTPEERKMNALYKTYETGKFIYGNSNPASEDFNSLADFCTGNDGTEIRIPWQLLNVSDPSHMTIHDDYYKNYGVEGLRVEELYAGIGTGGSENTIPLFTAELTGYKKPVWHERLKQSYYIVSDAWNR